MMKSMRRTKDLGIGGWMAYWYDNNTKNHRLKEMKMYAAEVASHIKNGATVLEVAPGPGYLSIELAKLGKYKIVGLDISKDFVEIARKNAKTAGVDVDFRQGNVADIVSPDSAFDFIICTAAFKNFKEPLRALTEMHRVLKPGGTALIIDMNKNASKQQLEASTREMGEKGLEAFFMQVIFKYFLKKGAYSKDEFNGLISKTEFKNHDISERDISLHVCLQK
jgi:ubiquinone/menaquinone biosynthesis C-methylase UbiE